MTPTTPRLMLGDCLERMGEIEDGSVDMVLADPPYGTTQCKWDSVIDLPAMWAHLNRVTKPKAAIVMTAAQPFTTTLIGSNLRDFRYDWTWRKPRGTGHLNAKRQPMRDKEDIAVFSSEPTDYYPQFGTGLPYTSAKGGKVSKASSAAAYGNFKNGQEHRNGSDGRRYPRQTIEFGVVERGTVHPTQKPVALMEYMIRTYTLEGETVLDFTMGSGTTGVACHNTGRAFIGIERDADYFAIAERRIADAATAAEQMPLAV